MTNFGVVSNDTNSINTTLFANLFAHRSYVFDFSGIFLRNIANSSEIDTVKLRGSKFKKLSWTHIVLTGNVAARDLKLYKNGNLVGVDQEKNSECHSIRERKHFVGGSGWKKNLEGAIAYLKIWHDKELSKVSREENLCRLNLSNKSYLARYIGPSPLGRCMCQTRSGLEHV